MNTAIILAGGTGTRIGAAVPKQFIEIMGKPILAYTLEVFQRNRNIDAIEIVSHRDWVEEVKRIADAVADSNDSDGVAKYLAGLLQYEKRCPAEKGIEAMKK